MAIWTVIGDVVIFLAGYAVSAYTWPSLRTGISGISNEISKLRARADALEAKIKSKV